MTPGNAMQRAAAPSSAQPRIPIDLTSLKYAVGMGLRWNSPFGPIRVDYGVNPDPKPGDKFGEFHFAVGTAF